MCGIHCFFVCISGSSVSPPVCLYIWLVLFTDSTNSVPYKNSKSTIFEKKNLKLWQGALYKISCSIYNYFFKYLYRNVVWNIKNNKFNIIMCDLLKGSVGELTIINVIRKNLAYNWDQTRPLKKHLFAVRTLPLWFHCALFFSYGHLQRLLFSPKKNNSSMTLTPPKNRDIHIEEYFLYILFIAKSHIIRNKYFFSIFKQRAYV